MNTTANPFIVTEPDQLQDYQQLLESRPAGSTGNDDSQNTQPSDHPSLPAIDQAMTLVADESIVLPPQLIVGVLHQGLKGIIGSNSKARKTWILLDLALSVATGTRWWKWNTVGGRVLVVNFEIPKAFLKQRIEALAKAKNLTNYSDLDIWTLRGHGSNFDDLIGAMIERIRNSRYSLIIIDPIYKGLSGKDENRAGDIGQLCDLLESLAVETGAAVLYAHHFSKGGQASKNPMDRLSGSGVFARDADSILVMTKHEEDDCYTVDLELRNLPEQEPFVVKWEYPVMRVECGKDPADLQGRPGRPKKADGEDVLELLKEKPLSHAEWLAEAIEDLKISSSTFNRRLEELVRQVKIEKTEDDKWRTVTTAQPANQPVQPPPQPPIQPVRQQCQNSGESLAPKLQAAG